MRRAMHLSFVLVLGGASTPARAAIEGENKHKNLLAVRTATPPVIDGRLDDSVWQDAPADDRFWQSFPNDGHEPSEQTEIRILYDDVAVYVGVRLLDREPERIVQRLTRRDREVEADTVSVGFDSRHDHSTAFVFVVGASGVQRDLLMFDDTDTSQDWDAVWDAEVRIDDRGWTAEFRVPLQVLRFSSAEVQEWGFNARRYISRKKEKIDWSHIPQDVNGGVSRWGHIQGLRGLRPRRALELRPFGVAAVRTSTTKGGAFLGLDLGADNEPLLDAGIDMKYGITSDLTLDATVNPDFGQIEADQVVLNLSRFETFFPEKRSFFLEGTDIFNAPTQVFYSRRIGRPPSGLSPGSLVRNGDEVLEVTRAPTALPIWAAAKFSGSLGDHVTLAVLDAVTGPEDVTAIGSSGTETVRRAPVRNYAVVRGRYSLGGASYLGFLGTSVNRVNGELARPSANHDAYVQSMDGQYRSSSGRWSAEAQAVISERVGGPSHVGANGNTCSDPRADPTCQPIIRPDGTRQGPGDVGFGGKISGGYAGEHWGEEIEYRTYSPKLDVNDLGFLNEFNLHNVRVGGRWRDMRPTGIFQNRSIGFSTGASWTYERVRRGWGASANVRVLFKNFMSASVGTGTSIPENWDQYETGDGAYFQRNPGGHIDLWIESDSRKKVTVGASGGAWTDYQGGAWGAWAESNLSFRVMSQLELDLGGSLGWTDDEVRNWFYDGCVDSRGSVCLQETDARTYRFAALSSGSLSFTLRGTYTVAPRLSLQAYAQVFMSQGEWSNRRVAHTLGPRPFIRRDMLEIDSSFTGDFDGDGIADDSFQDTTLNLNTVLRWELLPGTTLFGVYTRSQQAAFDLAGEQPGFRISGLSTGPTEEVILLKLIYYWT